MSNKFQETHCCKVRPLLVMADCPSCRSHRCHDCDIIVLWWQDFCNRCYNNLPADQREALKRHHTRLEGT